MATHWRELGKSIAIALIPGVVLPSGCLFLASLNMIAPGRGILPPLGSLLEIVGLLGFVIFSMPAFLVFGLIATVVNTLHQQGVVIPIFDVLSERGQGAIILYLCLAGNLLFWAMPVSFFRWFKNSWTTPPNGR